MGQERPKEGPKSPSALRWRPLLRRPLLFLLLLVVLQTAFTLASRDYWAFDEPRHADALRHLLEDGDWLSLQVNGRPYPDKPPVYFWLAAGAAKLLGTDGPPAFFLVSALGGFLFLTATWALARATLSRERDRLALLAPVLVLLTPLTQLLLRTTRMDLLFGALIVFAEVLLWRGLSTTARPPPGDPAPRGNPWIVLGLALGGLACVIKGPVGLALPLAALLAYCVWTGRARRLLCWDVGLGLTAAALPILLWILGLGLQEGWAYLRDTLRDQVLHRALGAHKHAQPFWFYIVVLLGAWLPWTAGISTFRWPRIFDRGAWRGRWARRRGDGRPTTWLWACFLSGLFVLSLATSKLFIYVMPLLAPLGVLSAGWWARLLPKERNRAALVTGVLLLLGALAALALPFALPRIAPDLTEIQLPPATWLLGALLLAAAVALFVRKARAFGLALLLLFGAYVVLALRVVPSFDPIMSPRAQAERLAALEDRGFAPLIFKVYPGTYAYYARRDIPETRDLDILKRHLEEHPKAVVATALKYKKRHPLLLGSLVIVHEQRIEGRPHVLLRQGPPPEEAPR